MCRHLQGSNERGKRSDLRLRQPSCRSESLQQVQIALNEPRLLRRKRSRPDAREERAGRRDGRVDHPLSR